MSDYTELVEWLRAASGSLWNDQPPIPDNLQEAADAIEELVARCRFLQTMSDGNFNDFTKVAKRAAAADAEVSTLKKTEAECNDHIGNLVIKLEAAEAQWEIVEAAATDNQRIIDELEAQVAEFDGALKKIVAVKTEAIGDTGFTTGPAALFAAVQRIARAALEQANETS